MISFESQKLLLPNLVWWCIIMSQIALQKDWFAVFKIKVTMKDHVIKIWLSSSELLILLRLNLVWWHIIKSWIVLWKDWTVLLWSRSQKRFKIPVNVHLDNTSSAAEPSVAILGMVIHYHGPKCHARRLVCYLPVQGHSGGSFIRYDCFYHICWTADLLATKCNWLVHHRKLVCFV